MEGKWEPGQPEMQLGVPWGCQETVQPALGQDAGFWEGQLEACLHPPLFQPGQCFPVSLSLQLPTSHSHSFWPSYPGPGWLSSGPFRDTSIPRGGCHYLSSLLSPTWDTWTPTQTNNNHTLPAASVLRPAEWAPQLGQELGDSCGLCPLLPDSPSLPLSFSSLPPPPAFDPLPRAPVNGPERQF